MIREGYQPIKNNDNPYLNGNLDSNDPPGKSMKVKFIASELVKKRVITIEIKGMLKFKARLFVAKILFYLGAFVLGCGINLKEQ